MTSFREQCVYRGSSELLQIISNIVRLKSLFYSTGSFHQIWGALSCYLDLSSGISGEKQTQKTKTKQNKTSDGKR